MDREKILGKAAIHPRQSPISDASETSDNREAERARDTTIPNSNAQIEVEHLRKGIQRRIEQLAKEKNQAKGIAV
jgi:hypothetical protein